MVVPTKIGKILVCHVQDLPNPNIYIIRWKGAPEFRYTKYNIKETDMRIKTATFTSPNYIDLTTGMYHVLISSPYHENFAGVILDVEYDKDTGLYNYQCQDYSRMYIQITATVLSKGVSIYSGLICLLTRGALKPKVKYTSKEKKNFDKIVADQKKNSTYPFVFRDLMDKNS